MSRRHAIIAGTNKAGTTSLFRYLSDHPDVCPSKVKETNFFESEIIGVEQDKIARYWKYFDSCASGSSVCLEASPKYMSLGTDVAVRIRGVISDAKLIFILREPVSRLLSYFFRNKQTRFHARMAQLDLEEFVALVEDASRMSKRPEEKGPGQNAFLQFEKGCYVKYLEEFSVVFDRKAVCVVFFDELVSDPHGCVTRVARFLDIVSVFYDDYVFQVENKTRSYRFAGIQHVGSKLNVLLEPLLNQYPGIRRVLRNMLLVKAESKPDVDDSLYDRLGHLYRPHNIALAEWVGARYPNLHLPAWLDTADHVNNEIN
ncbi:MAG: sulfotransferase domain-containing protein [Pseudomonadota bacterium]